MQASDLQRKVLSKAGYELATLFRDGFMAAKREAKTAKEKMGFDSTAVFGQVMKTGTMTIPWFQTVPGRGTEFLFGCLQKFVGDEPNRLNDALLAKVCDFLIDTAERLKMARAGEDPDALADKHG